MAQLTQLDAVNTILSAIGERPVSSLTSGSLDADLALARLNEVSREVQIEGWAFNTTFNEKWTSDANNEYTVRTEILSIDTSGSSAFLNIIQRGNRLYNPVGNNGVPLGFAIGSSHPTLYVSYIEELPFDSVNNATNWLPPTAQNYITKKAARVFVDRMLGDPALIRSAMIDEAKAFEMMKRTENNNADHNIFNTFDAVSTLSRRINYSNSVRYGYL